MGKVEKGNESTILVLDTLPGYAVTLGIWLSVFMNKSYICIQFFFEDREASRTYSKKKCFPQPVKVTYVFTNAYFPSRTQEKP